MTYTPIYAALLTGLFLYLSARVILARRAAQIGIGDGGDKALARAMRVHANFAEYAPLCLVLMAFIELQAGPAWLINIVGLMLLAGRLLHAHGVSQTPEPLRLRVNGMILTFLALGFGALANLGLVVAGSA